MKEKEIPRVLIVDDNESDRFVIERWLQGPGVGIVKARSGREALECILKEDFALILLDVQMPEMDGIQTAALIRQNARTKEIPIIFMTAFEKDDQMILTAYKVGGVIDYVFKPVVPEIIKAKVSVFVELYRNGIELRYINRVLKETLVKVKMLSGMLPICSSCKKIRDDQGYWKQVEVYVRDHSEAEFTHGICPECVEKIYGKAMRDKVLRSKEEGLRSEEKGVSA